MTAASHPTTERRAAWTHAGLSEYPAASLFNSPGGHASPGSLFAWEARQEWERRQWRYLVAPKGLKQQRLAEVREWAEYMLEMGL